MMGISSGIVIVPVLPAACLKYKFILNFSVRSHSVYQFDGKCLIILPKIPARINTDNILSLQPTARAHSPHMMCRTDQTRILCN